MNQLLLEGFILVFGTDRVVMMLIGGITFVVMIIGTLAILNHWGRSY